MELNLNGYTELPQGKIAAVVTYLEMRAQPAGTAGEPPEGLDMQLQTGVDAEQYRVLFRQIGEPWLWFSRLNLTDTELRKKLTKTGVKLWYLTREGNAVGLLEIDQSHSPDVEIVFFGVIPELVGRGAGSWLLRRGLEIIWAERPARVWLHTCTLDHPNALAFYMKHGFSAYKRAIEVDDDPRLTGRIRRNAAPHVPVL